MKIPFSKKIFSLPLQPFCDDMCIYDCTNDTLYPVNSAFHIRNDVIGMLPKDIIYDSYCDPEEKVLLKIKIVKICI